MEETLRFQKAQKAPGNWVNSLGSQGNRLQGKGRERMDETELCLWASWLSAGDSVGFVGTPGSAPWKGELECAGGSTSKMAPCTGLDARVEASGSAGNAAQAWFSSTWLIQASHGMGRGGLRAVGLFTWRLIYPISQKRKLPALLRLVTGAATLGRVV